MPSLRSLLYISSPELLNNGDESLPRGCSSIQEDTACADIRGFSSLPQFRQTLIPAITGRCTITEEERDLFALPVRDGGMGIPIPLQISSQQRSLSQKICSPLVKAVVRQQKVFDPNLVQDYAKNKQEVIHQHAVEKKSIAISTVKCLPPKLKRQIPIISQDGASSWLSPILLKAYDFVLHK